MRTEQHEHREARESSSRYIELQEHGRAVVSIAGVSRSRGIEQKEFRAT
jgi:hypothetical protein